MIDRKQKTATRIRRASALVTALGFLLFLASSANADEVPFNVAPPSLLDDGPMPMDEEGGGMSASSGDWSQPPLSVTHAWLRCDRAGAACVDTGVTGRRYTLARADVGSTIRVTATAHYGWSEDFFDGTVSATSNPSELIKYAAPLAVTLPFLTGTAREGQTLTVNNGEWESALPIVFRYVWGRCTGIECEPTGVTTQTYLLTAADVGKRLNVNIDVVPQGELASTTRLGAFTQSGVIEPSPTPPPPPRVTSNISAGRLLSGVVNWVVKAPGGTSSVEFWREKTQLFLDSTAPFAFDLDTTQYPNGRTHLGMAFTIAGVRHTQQVGFVTFENGKKPNPSGGKPAEGSGSGSTGGAGGARPGTGGRSNGDAQAGAAEGGATIGATKGVALFLIRGRATRDVLYGTVGADLIRGLAGNDTIFGRAGPDVIYGGAGQDLVYGGRGDDRLFGGAGRDRLYGESGNDNLNARDRLRDIVTCGAGRDTVLADRFDRVAPSCEVVRRAR